MQLSSLFKILAVSASLAVVPSLASAQTYPTRAIKIIVPAPPGGAIDTIARVVGDKLAVSMGQPVVVDNRPGASNNLGTDVLAKSAPDGYTIGIVGGSHNTNKFLFKNLGWDPEKSFEPIVYTHEVPLVFAIYPQIPAKTLPEFVAWMKANPDQAKVATSGRGSAQEMAAEMFRMASGVQMLLVPYKGSSAAQPDLLAGRTALYIDTISAIQSQVKAGNARAIAVSTRKRTTSLPDVPTAQEQGLKGYDANPVWTADPKTTPYRSVAASAATPAGAAPMSEAAASAIADFVVVDMYANYCTGREDVKTAMASAERSAKRIFR